MSELFDRFQDPIRVLSRFLSGRKSVDLFLSANAGEWRKLNISEFALLADQIRVRFKWKSTDKPPLQVDMLWGKFLEDQEPSKFFLIRNKNKGLEFSAWLSGTEQLPDHMFFNLKPTGDLQEKTLLDLLTAAGG